MIEAAPNAMTVQSTRSKSTPTTIITTRAALGIAMAGQAAP